MPSIDILVLAACVALAVLTLVVTWVRWQMGHGARSVVRGLGVVLLLAGLYVSTLAHLAGHGILSLVDWAQRTALDTRLAVGFSLVGVGLLFFLVGSFLRHRTREQAREVRRARKGVPATSGERQGQVAAKPPSRREPVARPVDDEDAEVAAILDRRGIN